MPELAFEFDQSVAHQARVEELLEEIKREDSSARRPRMVGTVPADERGSGTLPTTSAQDAGDCPRQETRGTVPKDSHE
jgi:hypothetical protein